MSVCVEEVILCHDDFCESGGYEKAIAVELNGRCPDVFPGELAKPLMHSCVAVDFTRDCDGETSLLCEERVVCILLLVMFFFLWEFH